MEVAYKRRTIEKIIRQKMNSWLKSITDEDLKDAVAKNYIVTGGAIASMLLGEVPNDFDVYLQDINVTHRLVNYYLDGYVKEEDKVNGVSRINAVINTNKKSIEIVIKSSGVLKDNTDNNGYEYFEAQGATQEALSRIEAYLNKDKVRDQTPYCVRMITSNAVSLRDQIQIITRFTGDPAAIHENFDFVHTKNYYTPQTGLVLNLASVEAIMTKELKYVGSLYPVCSLFRLRKFLKRGWTITAGEILKVAWDVSKLDLGDVDVLREQLIGVDTAYMVQLINVIENNRDKVDRTYLYALIDDVFDGSEIPEKEVEEILGDTDAE